MKANVCDMVSTSFTYIAAQTSTPLRHEGETDADYEVRVDEHQARTTQERSEERRLGDKAALYTMISHHISIVQYHEVKTALRNIEQCAADIDIARFHCDTPKDGYC